MEQLVLWQPECIANEKTTVVTCFLSSAQALSPSFENNEVIKEILKFLKFPETEYTADWKPYRSVYTIYPDDYDNINEGWSTIWLVTITLSSPVKCTTTHDENCFLNSGGVYEEKPSDPPMLIIADFESADNVVACKQELAKKGKLRLIMERTIRNARLHQVFFVVSSMKNSDKPGIDKPLIEEIFGTIKKNKGFYNYVLRTDELDEFIIDSGVKE
jgi:hypothetical protein